MRFSPDEAHELARRAAMRAGAREDVADSLAKAVVSAERAGKKTVGFAHLIDYLHAFAEGRIDGKATPVVTYPAPALIRVDAQQGIAQLGFDLAFEELMARAKAHGVATFQQHGSYTAGELGYYTRRLAGRGLLAMAVSNAPALMTTAESRKPILGTNPLSFAAPLENGGPLVFDQASSATAFVNVRHAAQAGEAIPEGWALDGAGEPTTDSREALNGALLAFGGARGANIALMVEVLAAGLTGANWSLDAPSFVQGGQSPSVGLCVVAWDAAAGFGTRLQTHIERLAQCGMHIPGRRGSLDELDIPDDIIEQLER
ncbi:malate/L-lactate dehydrogenase [Caballeronia arvi]|uniref:Malate/L-lactate dehydrogenase n=1 Tax=Caballeronia arvi TaxID=1777135 RepID=A0A158JMB0_9BURK|nr:Ldh family oxidoreductase [Caballeronia arvi]SAL70032.1 malate/L-lactate dehydrogenase [Caballeronia arvi]